MFINFAYPHLISFTKPNSFIRLYSVNKLSQLSTVNRYMIHETCFPLSCRLLNKTSHSTHTYKQSGLEILNNKQPNIKKLRKQSLLKISEDQDNFSLVVSKTIHLIKLINNKLFLKL